MKTVSPPYSSQVHVTYVAQNKNHKFALKWFYSLYNSLYPYTHDMDKKF